MASFILFLILLGWSIPKRS